MKKIKKYRIFAVSDIHGHYDEFIKLLKIVRFDEKYDKLVVLGDCVDKGPDSKKLLLKLMEMNKNGCCELILGNHEIMFLDTVLGKFPFKLYFRNGGKSTFLSFGINFKEKYYSLEEIQNIISHSLIRWLLQRPLYYETLDFIFVHAGIKPGIPLCNQNRDDLLWCREEFYKNYKSGKKVIFGHVPVQMIHGKNDIYVSYNSIGIDTGAGGNKYLTMVDCYSLKVYQVRINR
jgi:serine/threonine protein phosphatase 1